MNIRIFIIDEHGPSRRMLAHRLASYPEMEVVGSSDDGEDGLDQIEQLQPDLVLLDTKMKNHDGMDVCRRACANNGSAKVVVLTSYVDPEERRMAYQVGACGYFLKEVDTLRLAQQIRAMTAVSECSTGTGTGS